MRIDGFLEFDLDKFGRLLFEWEVQYRYGVELAVCVNDILSMKLELISNEE